MSECVEFALRRCGLRHSLTLKPEQLKSVEVVLAGSHVIAVLPTGYRRGTGIFQQQKRWLCVGSGRNHIACTLK